MGFGLGVLGAVIGIVVTEVGMPYCFSAALVGLLLLGAADFSYKQVVIRRTSGQIRQAIMSAIGRGRLLRDSNSIKCIRPDAGAN